MIKTAKNLPCLIVASCKGGVGKSTIAAALGSMIHSEINLKVGIIDADIWGASQHILLGCNDQRITDQNKPFNTKSGIQLFSMGMMSTGAIMWRNLLVNKFVDHMINNVQWNDIDIIIIDTPPGTGDVMIGLSRHISENSRAIIINTPQFMNSHIAKKSNDFFEKVKIPVVHNIYNMSSHKCSNCGHIDDKIYCNDDNKSYIPHYNAISEDQNNIEFLYPHLKNTIDNIFK